VDLVAGWVAGLDDVMARIARRFGRVEPRRRAKGYLLGLLSPLAGKNGWTIAEAAGDATPDGMQRLLNDYQRDADAVRDDLRAHVGEHLGDADGVLIVDETPPGCPRCSPTKPRTSSRAASASQRAIRNSRCSLSGSHARVLSQPPAVLPTDPRHQSRDQRFRRRPRLDRANRPAIRANPSSNIDCHRTAFTLSVTAAARSSVVHTTVDDHAVAAYVKPPAHGLSNDAVGVLRRSECINL
jgi:hypothetical protein